MKRLCILLAGSLVMALGHGAAAAPVKPVYVGVRACAQCHSGPATGNQYSKWLLSKHSRAYATLTRPESWEITRLSGLKLKPWEEPVCLGCHTTASFAEDWEKDEGFRKEDGMQCEMCHGPGSEYMAEEVMRDRVLAAKAGLRTPGKEYCMGCHVEKASHVTVLKTPKFDFDKAFAEIAHPRSRAVGARSLPAATPAEGNGAAYVGSEVCGECHRGQKSGHQYNTWRATPHAQAWAVLASKRAAEIAREKGLAGDPQTAPECLACHTTGGPRARARETLHPDEGVGCESCHGPGSAYIEESVMRDRAAAMKAGLRVPAQTGCLHCHQETHGKTFDPQTAWAAIAHPSKLPPRAETPRYKTPLNLALRPDSKELYVTCEAADAVAVIDTVARRKVAEIPVGTAPNGVAFTPDGRRAFVSNREDDTVSVIDTAARKVIATLPAGDEPHGLLTDAAGRYLYVLNTSSDDISVFEVAGLKRIKSLAAGRGPWSLALSPDGARLLATNMYSHLTGFRKPLRSEATAISTSRAVVEDRWMIPDTNLMMGVDWHPSGRFALATMNRTKNLVPMTRLLQGWVITNGLAVIWNDGRVDEVLLDQPGMGFSDANDVAITPDGRYALVTSSGTDRVAVVDVASLTGIITASDEARRRSVLANHLGQASQFIAKYISVGASPRGITISPDGGAAFVAAALDDRIDVIDLRSMKLAQSIDLEGPKVITRERFGERLFHSASICYRRQFSCSSCHPNGHVDSVTYDIEADGIGVSPVDNRTLRGINDTAPFKWEGTNATLSRQCGPRLSVFFTRIQPFTPEELSAIDLYITTIPRPPNRYWRPGDKLTNAQRRGKAIFRREVTNDGREIPIGNRCVTCHMPPYYTSRHLADVGTRQALDRTGDFDIPHLNNIYDSAPYLHNGMAATLEEIWTVHNPDDKHGVTNDLTKDQLNDLIEYLKTL